jgi:hypothetical protein
MINPVISATVSLPVLTNLVTDAETCKKVCAALAAAYRAHIKYGPEEPLIGIIGTALEKMGVEDKEDFLKKCSITINRDIYLNFRIGDSSIPYSAQIATVAHECEHVAQGRKIGVAVFYMRYFSSTAHRSEFEARAFAVSLEVLYRITGKMPDIEKLASRILWYKCTDTDAQIIEKHLAIIANTLSRGGIISDQMRVITKALGK